MHLGTPEAGWQVTAWYLLILFLLSAAMKWISLLVHAGGTTRERAVFFFAPSLAYPAWRKRQPLKRGERVRISGKAAVLLLVMGVYYVFFAPLLSRIPWWCHAYLAVIPFWLLLETLQALFQLIWPDSERLVPPVNRRPLMSSGLSDFWGRRWNRLFGDWLYQVCFRPLKKWPFWALFLPFGVSAGIHELLVSLPYWIVYGESLFGWMVGYFCLQYLGVLVTRKRWRGSPLWQRVVCWVVVLVPVPLVLNPGTLEIFRLVR